MQKETQIAKGNHISFGPYTDTYSEPCQTSKMEHFAKIING